MQQSNNKSIENSKAIGKVSLAVLASLTGSIIGAFLGKNSLTPDATLEAGPTIAMYSFLGMFLAVLAAVLLRNMFSSTQLKIINSVMIVFLVVFAIWLLTYLK